MVETVVVVAALVGLVEAFKRALLLPSNVVPLVSISFGIIAMFFLSEGDVALRVFEGIVSGLTASGLYSGTRAVAGL